MLNDYEGLGEVYEVPFTGEQWEAIALALWHAAMSRPQEAEWYLAVRESLYCHFGHASDESAPHERSELPPPVPYFVVGGVPYVPHSGDLALLQPLVASQRSATLPPYLTVGEVTYVPHSDDPGPPVERRTTLPPYTERTAPL